MKGSILIVDYGSQYTQLIARKIRKLNVYTVIYRRIRLEIFNGPGVNNIFLIRIISL